jgi:hypothetical protein
VIRACLLSALIVWGAASLRADTIYQTNSRGQRVVIHRDTILVSEDSTSIVYKHFELKERRVEKVRLSQGSVPYFVDRSSPEEDQRIVQVWKRFGYTARVTDSEGKTTQVYDAYLDFYPPEGRGSLLESVPARTTFPVLIEGGGAEDFEFSRLAKVEFLGDRLKITLRDGQVVNGRFLMPTDKPAEARILGITNAYNPESEDVFDFSLPFARIREIDFGN